LHAGRDEVLELLGAGHVGGQLLEGAHDRRRARRVDARPDARRGGGLEPAARLGTGTGRRVRRRSRARRHDRREEVDLVDHVVVDVRLREVEAQKVERDLLVLRLDLLEESPDVRGRDVAVGVAQRPRHAVEPLGELADARRDLLGRRGVDLARDGADVVVQLAEVERVAGLRREERLLNAAEELVEGPQRLEPLGQANVVFVEELDSLDGHRFTVPRLQPF
jgi:hypothetical protein